MKTSFEALLGLSKQAAFNAAIQNRHFSREDVPFADTVGFHIYCDLDLRLSLAAAEDTTSALLYLQILQAYASAAEACGEVSDIKILEVQGQRLHLFREAATALNFDSIISFSENFFRLASRKIAPLAKDHEFFLRIAADYGRAILLRSSGADTSDSLVSLGTPANRPAKKLAREVRSNGVPASHLAFNSAAIFDEESEKWELVDLSVPVSAVNAKQASLLLEAANTAYEPIAKSATFHLSRKFEENPKNPVNAPVRHQGFVFRADLDGFSARVKHAIKGGDQAILKLVKEFQAIMQYPAHFKSTLPEGVSVLLFPWAGDCANMLLVCSNYTFERSYLPNTAALSWHAMTDRSSSSTSPDWRALMDKCKWLVAIAGGENHGADHGYILTGNVYASGRTFHVGAGWGWRRSLDAEQSQGTKAEQTVIQTEDYTGLDSTLRRPFEDHPYNPSLFKVADLDKLRTAQGKHQTSVSSSVVAASPSLIIPPPRPKPHAD